MERTLRYFSRFIEPQYEVGSIWGANEFEQYLKDLGRSREALRSVKEYPEEIELSEGFHTELNELRDTLTSGNEHLKILGYSNKKDKLIIPKTTVEGTSMSINGADLLEQGRKGFLHGVSRNLGFIHTHPRLQSELEEPDFQERFSPSDLWFLATDDNCFFFTGVIGIYENILAFKCKETLDTTIDPMLFNGNSFSEYWFNQYGFDRTEQSGVLSPRSVDSNSTDMTMGIAARHKLVLYAGQIDQPLYRYYPFASVDENF